MKSSLVLAGVSQVSSTIYPYLKPSYMHLQIWRLNSHKVKLTYLKPIKDSGQWPGSAIYKMAAQILDL